MKKKEKLKSSIEFKNVEETYGRMSIPVNDFFKPILAERTRATHGLHAGQSDEKTGVHWVAGAQYSYDYKFEKGDIIHIGRILKTFH
jgi:hypothetical protein